MKKRTLFLVPLLLTLAACGGESASKKADKPASASPESPSASASTSGGDDIRKQVVAYSDAFLTGDSAAAYPLLSQRCRKRMSKEEFADLVSQAAKQYGSPLSLRTFKAEVNGDQARVTYTYAVSDINQDREPWVREGGSWHEDDC